MKGEEKEGSEELVALKSERRAISHGRQVASRSPKARGMDSFLQPPEGMLP